MYLFLFQFFGVALVLGGGAGLALRAWDNRKVDVDGEVDNLLKAAK